MSETDFIFDRVEEKDGYCDYWFRVTGETKDELTRKYMEQSMVEVSGVVFGMTDGQWGVKRIFPFNYDIITPDDKDLENLVRDIASKKAKAAR